MKTEVGGLAGSEGRVIERVKARVEILPELCKGCELCIVACPTGNLLLSERLNSKGYRPVEWRFQGTEGECSACGICYWVCPDSAIAEILEVAQDG